MTETRAGDTPTAGAEGPPAAGPPASSRYSVLVGAGEFSEALARDIGSASRRIQIQTLSFEGDGAGLWLADLLLSSRSPDRRLLIDEYSLVKVSDHFVRYSRGRRDPALRHELAEMARAVAQLRADGVRVLFTNPLGPLIVRLPARNHKKLAVVDDVVYLGGINFSDHNFAWHDMMLRVEDPELAGFLAADVDATCRGIDRRAIGYFEGIQVHLLDGRTNEAAYDPVLRSIDAAETSIFLESPYVTYPFLDRLIEARRRGVEVTLVMPADSNYPAVAGYAARTATRAGIPLRLIPGMIHLKAMLIDGRTLVVGSSNLDIVSYRCEQEIVAVVTAPEAVSDFVERVLEPDLAASLPAAGSDDAIWRSTFCRLQLLGADLWSLLARSV